MAGNSGHHPVVRGSLMVHENILVVPRGSSANQHYGGCIHVVSFVVLNEG